VLREIGIHEAWVALGVWLVAFVAMSRHLLRPTWNLSRAPGPEAGPGRR
jgi:hypothetical protein